MKKQNTVNYASYGGRQLHPKIRVEGKYLAQFGFNIGDTIETTVEENRIVITRLSHEDLAELSAEKINQTPNPMDTPTEKAPKAISSLFLIEKGTYVKGEEFITITSKPPGATRHRAVAHVYLEYDAEGKTTFLTKDREGNEILPPTHTRYDLKKQLLANEQQLIEALDKQKEQTPAAPEQKPAEPEQQNSAVQNAGQKQRKPRVPSKSKSRTQELSQTRAAAAAPENEQSQSQTQ